MSRKKQVSNQSPVSSIKRAQRESLYFRKLSELVTQLLIENNDVFNGLMVSRARLSPDKSTCFLYFYTVGGEEAFQKAMPNLILYKPSMRKALSEIRSGRYVPELLFKFDDSFEKQHRLDELLSDIKESSNDIGRNTVYNEDNDAEDNDADHDADYDDTDDVE